MRQMYVASWEIFAKIVIFKRGITVHVSNRMGTAPAQAFPKRLINCY